MFRYVSDVVSVVQPNHFPTHGPCSMCLVEQLFNCLAKIIRRAEARLKNQTLLVFDVVESRMDDGANMVVRERIIDVLPVPPELDQVRKTQRLQLV